MISTPKIQPHTMIKSWKILSAYFLTWTAVSFNLPITDLSRSMYRCWGTRFSLISFVKTFMIFILQKADLSWNLFKSSSKNFIFVCSSAFTVCWFWTSSAFVSFSCGLRTYYIVFARILIKLYLNRYASQSKKPNKLLMFWYTALGANFDSLLKNFAIFFIPIVSCELSVWKIYFVKSLMISPAIYTPCFWTISATNSAKGTAKFS